ncbi:hypothetical protein LTR05_002555 [Lithohypha guttulata]|uniref:Uncharacterized protein n=1 Tax=Lithohypha guttulata TaxID=1690604 RepID=A0AAN7T428_9EURO|nr:hypothetical protein LTR05_002555 [Lithohypha guttulata]
MPFKWTPESEREMLFQIIKSLDIKPPQSVFTDVAAVIGEGTKFYKLKREAEALHAKAGEGGVGVPNTPSTKKSAAKAKPTPKSLGKKRKATIANEDDEPDAIDTPTKKPKKEEDEDEQGNKEDQRVVNQHTFTY